MENFSICQGDKKNDPNKDEPKWSLHACSRARVADKLLPADGEERACMLLESGL